MNPLWSDDSSTDGPEWDGLDMWDGTTFRVKGRTMKAKTGLAKMGDADVVAFVRSVIESGTGKTELADTTPPISDVETLCGQCETALTQEGLAEDLLQTRVSDRVDKVGQLRGMFSLFTQSVDALYESDETKLQAIGLPIRNPQAPIGSLSAPANVRSEVGEMEGTVIVRWNAVRGRYLYEAEFASSVAGPWARFYYAAGLQTVCAGLTPGAEYWFRVRAIGKAGPSPWSDLTRRRAA